jgi:NADPH:quinone reductase-like Zn-dependent oxidoreductase
MNDNLKRIAALPEQKRLLLMQKLMQTKNARSDVQLGGDVPGQRQPSAGRPYCLHIGTPGNFQSFGFRDLSNIQPGLGQITISTKAIGINFRDLMIAMNLYPPTPGVPSSMGSDIAGTVLACGEGVAEFKPGDEVIALSAGNFSEAGVIRADCHFPSHAVVYASQAVHKPRRMNFHEAACFPTVFLTSYFSIKYAARLQKDERILIHSATGGVGMSALQVARWCGAEIYAAAGSPEKRDYLKNLGVRFVMDSTSSYSQVMEYTRQQGVDVILNTLPGEFLVSGLQSLRPFGRFIQISKQDAAAGERLPMETFRNGLTFTTVDIALFVARKDLLKQLLLEICSLIDAGDFGKLPFVSYPVQNIGEALTFMSRRKHIGKIILSYE